MFVWKEGQEFKLSDPVGWHSLQVGAGMVIEVLLTGEAAGGHSDLWAGLLVTSVHLAGDDDPYLLLYVKSLGCSDPDVSKRPSSWFNRRAGQVHLCLSDPCLLEEDCPLHVTTLRVYSPEGFKRDYMTAATVKQLKKWLEDLGLDDPADRPRPEGIPPPAGAGAGEEEEEPGFPLDGFAGHGRAPARDKEKKELGDERVAAEERQGLRERLMKVRERMTGRLGDNGAGKRAGRPRGVEDPIYVSSSEGYSPSELDAVAKEEKKVKKDKTKRKRKERPLDPAGPSRALAIPGKELRVQFDEEPGQRDRKKKKMRAAQTEGVAVEAAISGTTTGSLQRQLMARAAEAVNERQAKKKEKKTSKDPGKQLAQILTKVVGKKKNKKDKAKRRRRKKKGGGEDPPGGGSGDSSGSSQTSSCEGGSGGLSGDDETSSSESAKMQPPLRRKALQHPGSVLRMLIEHAPGALGSNLKGFGRAPRRGRRHPGDSDLQLFPDCGAEPIVGDKPSAEGTSFVGSRRRSFKIWRAGQSWRLARIALRVAPPGRSRWALGSGTPHGGAVLRGHLSSWAGNSAQGPQACQDGGPSCWQRAGQLERRRKRTREVSPAMGGQQLARRRQRTRQERGQRPGARKRSLEGTATTGSGSRLAAARKDPRKVRRLDGAVSVLAPAVHDKNLSGDVTGVQVTSETPAFCGGARDGMAGIPTMRESIERCNSFCELGCMLAWWVISGAYTAEVGSITREFFGSWLDSRAAEDRLPLGRPKAATFPLREGDLSVFVGAMRACTLHEACQPDALKRWSVDAWTYLVFVGLNALSGAAPRPKHGGWTSVEKQAAQSIRGSVTLRCQKDTEPTECSESTWKKDLNSRVVGYGGEEMGVCETLTLEQVLPALPPQSHGGVLMRWIGSVLEQNGFYLTQNCCLGMQLMWSCRRCLVGFMLEKGTSCGLLMN